jgi:hypothetical protein
MVGIRHKPSGNLIQIKWISIVGDTENKTIWFPATSPYIIGGEPLRFSNKGDAEDYLLCNHTFGREDYEIVSLTEEKK